MTASDQGPLAAFRTLRRQGKLRGDPHQELAAEKLQSLWHRLQHYRPDNGGNGPGNGQGGWMQVLSFGRRREPPPAGLYIYGEVGRGKSMLMDLFFAAAPTEPKRRVHFHAFMQEVHGAIHRWRQTDPAEREGDDPIPPVAKAIAQQAALLCFDEFQVSDVADAMILGRLFQQLFELGVVVVATSNRAPDELYLDGLNRPLFLPFIALFKEKLDVLHLEGETDYRLDRLQQGRTWLTPLGPAATAALDADFAALTDEATPQPLTLTVPGRELIVARQARRVARFAFAELCEQPLGPADYLAIARAFHTVILDGIPRLAPEQRNEAKRFVTLIDALYEAKCKLVAAAAAEPEDLYPEGDDSFEFKRCASRLREMQSAEYLSLVHKGQSA